MQINHLCFVLPADLDEIEVYDHQEKHESSADKKVTKRSLHDYGGHLLEFIRNIYFKVSESKWSRFCHCNCKPHRTHNSGVFHDMDGVQVLEKIGRENPRIFSFAELFIGSKGFSEDETLGSGGFGKVYRAVLPSDGTVVAVKCLLEKGQQFEKTFAAELAAVAQLRHKNLVRLRGWCVHDEQLYLVYDYMPNRSLDRLLFKRPENPAAEPPLDWSRRWRIVKGLASALHYLHEQLETQIIHRDVKASNVMLDSDYNAKLGDFGLARWLEHELEYQTSSTRNPQFRLAETTRIGGTIGYLPPESFHKRSFATSKSDVFSFGVVVLEVVSGRRAIDLAYPDDQIILLDWMRRLSDEKKLLQAGDTRLVDGSYKLADMEHLTHIALLCTLQTSQSRPSMKWVLESLSEFSGQLPALPSFHSDPVYISLSQTSTSGSYGNSTRTTTESILSNYLTANAETMYVTAEDRNNGTASSKSISQKRSKNFYTVEAPREISFKEIISITNNFSDSRRIAELDFGTAYHGFLDRHFHVLIKRLGMKTCPALRTRFANELENLGRLRHRNLVQLRGWCTEQGEMLVVYDFSANRLLSHLLCHHDHRFGKSILKWHQRYNIIKSLASAILYLHEEWDEQVIHRNITSSAIILEPDMNPRLSSFALAEFLTRNEHGHHVVLDTKKSVRGIFGYMSPEYMESGQATTMADIYSFGVVILEIVSGQMAVDFRRPEALLVKRALEFEVRERPLEEIADMKLSGEYSIEELTRLVKLGMACTRSNPELRPSIRQIVSVLDGNDRGIMKDRYKERMEDWKERNASSLSLVKRIQALGIQ